MWLRPRTSYLLPSWARGFGSGGGSTGAGSGMASSRPSSAEAGRSALRRGGALQARLTSPDAGPGRSWAASSCSPPLGRPAASTCCPWRFSSWRALYRFAPDWSIATSVAARPPRRRAALDRRAGRPLSPAQAPDDRQFEGRAPGVDAEGQTEQVQIEPFFPAYEDAAEAQKRELQSLATRRRQGGQGPSAEVVFPDRRGGQIEAQFGNRPGHVCREGVAVGAGPETIRRGVWVGGNRCLNLH